MFPTRFYSVVLGEKLFFFYYSSPFENCSFLKLFVIFFSDFFGLTGRLAFWNFVCWIVFFFHVFIVFGKLSPGKIFVRFNLKLRDSVF